MYTDIMLKSADVNWLKITYVCMHVAIHTDQRGYL